MAVCYSQRAQAPTRVNGTANALLSTDAHKQTRLQRFKKRETTQDEEED